MLNKDGRNFQRNQILPEALSPGRSTGCWSSWVLSLLSKSLRVPTHTFNMHTHNSHTLTHSIPEERQEVCHDFQNKSTSKKSFVCRRGFSGFVYFYPVDHNSECKHDSHVNWKRFKAAGGRGGDMENERITLKRKKDWHEDKFRVTGTTGSFLVSFMSDLNLNLTLFASNPVPQANRWTGFQKCAGFWSSTERNQATCFHGLMETDSDARMLLDGFSCRSNQVPPPPPPHRRKLLFSQSRIRKFFIFMLDLNNFSAGTRFLWKLNFLLDHAWRTRKLLQHFSSGPSEP